MRHFRGRHAQAPVFPRCSSKEDRHRSAPGSLSQLLQRHLPKSLFPSIPAHTLRIPPRPLPSPRPFSVLVCSASLPANRDASSTDSPRSRSRASQGEVNLETRELVAGSGRRQPALPTPPLSAPLCGVRVRGRVLSITPLAELGPLSLSSPPAVLQAPKRRCAPLASSLPHVWAVC